MERDLVQEAEERFDKVAEVVTEDLATVRTGRAKPDMVGSLVVNVYGGQRMKLLEVANISAPDPSLIIIEPWDKSIVQEIEKAISDSKLRLSPAVSEGVIRVPVPALTEERRQDFVKLLHQKIESGKVMLRQARQDIRNEIDKQKGRPGVSEDDIKNQRERLQKMFDEYGQRLVEMGEKKEEEVMAV